MLCCSVGCGKGRWDEPVGNLVFYFRHCVDLFLDFITLFRKLMMILAMNEKVSPPAPEDERMAPELSICVDCRFEN